MSIIGSPIIVGKKPEQAKTVSPSTSQQIVTPDSGMVLSSVTVNAAPLQAKTVPPTTSQQIITPDGGNYGLSSVTVNAAPLQAKTVTPTASGFTVSPDNGKYGLSSVKVNGNSNLVAGNIKSGVTIFGVTGNYAPPVTSAIVISGMSSTDTVTCSGGEKSYPATWNSTTQHWEILGLPLGTFTVTATNGIRITTQTVLIDIVGVYEIEMTYILYLYRDGNEYENITGGWINGNAGTGHGTETFTKNATDLYLCATGYYGYNGKVYALLRNPINLKDYKTIFVEIKSLEARASQNLSQYYAYGGIVIKSEQAGQYTELPFVTANSVATINFSGNKSINISSYSGNVNIGLYANGNRDNASMCKMNVSKVWLE